MDPVGKITGVALVDKEAIEDSKYKLLGVFDRKVKGWKRLRKPGPRGRIGENIGCRTWWELTMTDSIRIRSALQTKS